MVRGDSEIPFLSHSLMFLCVCLLLLTQRHDNRTSCAILLLFGCSLSLSLVAKTLRWHNNAISDDFPAEIKPKNRWSAGRCCNARKDKYLLLFLCSQCVRTEYAERKKSSAITFLYFCSKLAGKAYFIILRVPATFTYFLDYCLFGTILAVRRIALIHFNLLPWPMRNILNTTIIFRIYACRDGQ